MYHLGVVLCVGHKRIFNLYPSSKGLNNGPLVYMFFIQQGSNQRAIQIPNCKSLSTFRMSTVGIRISDHPSIKQITTVPNSQTDKNNHSKTDPKDQVQYSDAICTQT